MPTYYCSAQNNELINIGNEISDLQNQLRHNITNAVSTNENLVASDNVMINLDHFFQFSNIGLWLLWSILISILLLLFAVHRNIKEISFRYSNPDQLADPSKNHSDIFAKPIIIAPAPSLVKPEKVVTIKVRKIKK